MNDSLLYQLIQQIEYKTNLHIGVLFFKNYGNKMCEVPNEHQIHTSPICDFFKEISIESYSKCVRCRNYGIKKALKTQKAFCGLCINGVFEYTHPVLVDNNVAAVIFVGNILDGENSLCKMIEKTNSKVLPLETLEKDCSAKMCESICITIDNYIQFLLEKYQDFGTDEKPIIKNIKSYIERNLDFELCIKNVADVFHYNPRYLCRLFKKETGTALNEYILCQRLKRAKNLLCTTSHSIIEISMEIGFKNVTYFNKLFKKQFDITPSGYRKQYKKGAIQ